MANPLVKDINWNFIQYDLKVKKCLNLWEL